MVYIQNGWVLTANHVGQGIVNFGGASDPSVPGSKTRLVGDLAVLKLATDPGLPTPVIASTTPPTNAELILIGRGKNRDAPTSWMGLDGWTYTTSFATIRWGTNKISNRTAEWLDTESYELAFDELGTPASTPHEGQSVNGDSGGGVFWKTGGQWQLSGIMFLQLSFQGQPANSALYTNATVAADLSKYRSEILSLTGNPSCSDGLDDDLDGLIDHPADPGCDGPDDTSEKSPDIECDDGLDNDGDQLIDYPDDPQCHIPGWDSETVAVPVGAFWFPSVLAVGLAGVDVRMARREGEPQSKTRTR